MGSEYRMDCLLARSSLDLYSGPTVQADVMTGSKGFLGGIEVSYDVSQAKLSKWSYGVGYVQSEYALTLKQ